MRLYYLTHLGGTLFFSIGGVRLVPYHTSAIYWAKTPRLEGGGMSKALVSNQPMYILALRPVNEIA